MVAPTVLWLSFFFVVPLLIVVAVSFASRTPYGQVIFDWTLGNYARFTETLYLSIFADTLIVAVITTFLTILLGYPLAYFIAQLPKKWQQPGLILVMIPLLVESSLIGWKYRLLPTLSFLISSSISFIE